MKDADLRIPLNIVHKVFFGLDRVIVKESKHLLSFQFRSLKQQNWCDVEGYVEFQGGTEDLEKFEKCCVLATVVMYVFAVEEATPINMV